MPTVLRHVVENLVDQPGTVDSRELFADRARRFDARERGETGIVERIEHRTQSRRRLWMTRTGIVFEAAAVGIEGDVHRGLPDSIGSIASIARACDSVRSFASAAVDPGTHVGNGVSST